MAASAQTMGTVNAVTSVVRDATDRSYCGLRIEVCGFSSGTADYLSFTQRSPADFTLHTSHFRLLQSHLLLVVLLPVLFFSDHLVAILRDLQLPGLFRRRGSTLLRAERKGREQPLHVLPAARRAFDGLVLPHEPLELVAAASTSKIVERHRKLLPARGPARPRRGLDGDTDV